MQKTLLPGRGAGDGCGSPQRLDTKELYRQWGTVGQTLGAQMGGTEASEEEARSLQGHAADGPYLPGPWSGFAGGRA